MEQAQMIARISQALGRTQPAAQAPRPPLLDPRIVRTVDASQDLLPLFVQQGALQKLAVHTATRCQLAVALVDYLRRNGIQSVAISEDGLLADLGIAGALREAGLEVCGWSQTQRDSLYDKVQCGLTEAAYGVAETGSIVIRPSAGEGRGLSLVPLYHVAILEQKNLLPDLLDLLTLLRQQGGHAPHTLICGPSKTADIEMNVVTGIHGPNVVGVFVLSE
jgi:L-lactate dehydrogenase complex protein LldG